MSPNRQSEAAFSSWLPYRKSCPGASLRLFCFPYAGGSAAAFRGWVRSLPPALELCAVQLPGRERRLRESALTRFEPLVEALIEALSPFFDLPFAFFGHSLGARLAYELSRRLVRDARAVPVKLLASGSRAPHLPNREPPIHHLPDERVLERLRTLGGTPEAVLQHEELMKLMLPVIRADFELSETYSWEEGPPLSLPMTVFGGSADRLVSPWEVEAWEEHTTASFRLEMFEGDHFFLQEDQDRLLKLIAQELGGYV